jgi:phospholipid transport system substrate-binding protein
MFSVKYNDHFLSEDLMRKGHLYLGLVSVLLLVAFPLPVCAGLATEQVKSTTDKIIAIVTDPTLKEPAQEEKKKSLIMKAVDERFDWREMSRRSLGPHWRKLNEEQRKNFVTLFSQLLERTYLDRVESYSGEKVTYAGEKVDGDYATVESTVLTSKNVDTPVVYKLKKDGDSWLVYDISIEGVSLVYNYRTQFNSILSKSSYDELIAKLKEKIAEK